MKSIYKQITLTKKFSELPSQEQPANRLNRLPPKALHISELLSISLGMGNMDIIHSIVKLMDEYKTLRQIPRERLLQVNGVSEGIANKIQAIVEIAARENSYINTDSRPMISSPEDVFNIVKAEMQTFDHEEFWIMLLDSHSRLKRIIPLYKGNVSVCSIRSAEIFKEAILSNSPAIILIHNHPSGYPLASVKDIKVTQSIVQAGKLLDIQVMDHIIIGDNRFTNLRSEECFEGNL